MTPNSIIRFAGGLAWAVVLHVSAANATSPAAGTYSTIGYVSAETANCTGLAPVGSTLTGFFDYPGPGKPGALSRNQILGVFNGILVNEVELLSYPITPAAGQTSWSGSYRGAILPTFPKFKPIGTFTATLTFGNAASFFMTFTYTIPVAGGNCVATFVTNFTKT